MNFFLKKRPSQFLSHLFFSRWVFSFFRFGDDFHLFIFLGLSTIVSGMETVLVGSIRSIP